MKNVKELLKASQHLLQVFQGATPAQEIEIAAVLEYQEKDRLRVTKALDKLERAVRKMEGKS